MVALFKKAAYEPTLEERHNGALAQTQASLSVFQDIKEDVLSAADEQAAVEEEARGVIERHQRLADAAAAEQARNLAAVEKLTELFG